MINKIKKFYESLDIIFQNEANIIDQKNVDLIDINEYKHISPYDKIKCK